LKLRKNDLLLKGIGVSPGIIIGKASLVESNEIEALPIPLSTEAEINREINKFEQALDESKQQLLKLKQELEQKNSKEARYIIDAQILILEDKLIIEKTINTIREKKIDSVSAVKDTVHGLSKIFDDVADEYLKERKTDIDYIGERIITNIQVVKSGDTIIVDGTIGVVIVRPTAETLQKYYEKKQKYEQIEKNLFEYKCLPSQTLDGFHIKLLANIELVEELPSVLEYGAEGIGLYRTEFLYLNRKVLPNEEEHFKIYQELVKKIAPYPVTIRTLDLGGDKFLSRIDLVKEMNPIMGLRAIRFCLKEVDIFKTQLRAILRASALGEVKVLFPMISGMQEILQIKEILEELKDEFKKNKIPFNPDIKIGIMIEIPSAAAIADLLAKEVDFFSIGTNDLIQYTLAIDRVNEQVSYLYNPLHPSVIRLIKSIVEAAHDNGIEVVMCGEMAGDPLYLPLLLGLGIDQLSMNPLCILKVKKVLRSITYHESQELVKDINQFTIGKDIENFMKQEMAKRFQEEFVLH